MRKIHFLLDITKIFYPNSNLLTFIKFWVKLSCKKYSIAFNLFSSLLISMSNCENNSDINDFANDRNSLSEIISIVFRTICENNEYFNDYQMEKFLEILYYTDFNIVYSNYYINYCFIDKLLTKKNLHFSNDPLIIYRNLIDSNLLEEAKAYAEYYGMMKEFAEITEFLEKLKTISQLECLTERNLLMPALFKQLLSSLGYRPDICFKWIYKISGNIEFSLKEQTHLLFLSGCLAKQIKNDKTSKIKFKFFYIFYAYGIYPGSRFDNFEFNLYEMESSIGILINKLPNAKKALDFKTLFSDKKENIEFCNESFKFALNNLDFYFLTFSIKNLKSSASDTLYTPINFYQRVNEFLKENDFWDFDYSSFCSIILQNNCISIEFAISFDEKVKASFNKDELCLYKQFLKSIFLLMRIYVEMENIFEKINIINLMDYIRQKNIDMIFEILIHKNRYNLVKKYLKLMKLDSENEVTLMLDYFFRKIDFWMENKCKLEDFWSFNQYINFVEILSNPAILTKTLLNYLKYNDLELEATVFLFF